MAEPLAILGGVGAGLQLVSAASTALLATIRLIRDLREVPPRLAGLLSEVDSSLSRLCHSCDRAARIYQCLDQSQSRRLQECAASLQDALQEIQNMLTPLFRGAPSSRSPIKNLWKSFLSIKIENDLTEKLQKLNRINIEMIKELSMIGLEVQLDAADGAVTISSEIRQGFTDIETKMDSLQTEFQHFAISVQKANDVSMEDAGSLLGTESSGTTLCGNEELSAEKRCAEVDVRVSQEQTNEILAYLATSSGPGITIAPGDKQSTHLSQLLYSVRCFYSPSNSANLEVVSQRPKFWEDTDLAIYLMKVTKGSQRGASRSETRGLRILKESTTYAGGTLSQSTNTIIIELLSTLSPVNTTTCPYVREGLLRYLHELVREQLPRTHPITLVISTLYSDGGDRAVSLRALTFIFERLQATLGPVHDLTQLAVYRLCGLLRRSGDYAEALRVASDSIRATRSFLGGRAESLPERWVARQIEHVYMDQGDWVAALRVCFDIVGQRDLVAAASGGPDPLYHDECAVYTMEDIAKACEGLGKLEAAMAWLKQAAVSASMVWGEGEALAHINDKLRELQRQTGQMEDLAMWAAIAGEE